MTADVSPAATKVIAHEVQVIQKLGHRWEVKVLETVFSNRERTGQEIIRSRKSFPNGSEEE